MPKATGRGRPDVDKAFGQVLRKLRRARGLSQEALWPVADRSYVSLLERGVNSPSLRMLFALAEALDVKPSEMVAQVEDELRRGG